MTVLSAQTIRRRKLLIPFTEAMKDSQGRSAGLSAASYDLRVAETMIVFPGDFRLTSTIEEFQMPGDLSAVVRDKSTLARLGLSMFNTHIDPGFRGFLTLEMRHYGRSPIEFNRGDAVAQVVFEMLDELTEMPYDGKYQDQEAGPQEAR